ncbi:UDP-sugar hydrolase [Klebsiella pneumoniae]|uniref:UDP-sugar hydrolase n=1 Tax=Klebsiella pneumoniae TaxID=573 RepID=A0A377TPB9_KLEPN|nr:UDP-sugar hydrolase [Klebsiella pneumoniae]
MSGKEVVDYLTAVAQMKPDSGAYPQFANVSFVAKDGKLNDLKIKGEPVDPAKTYRMATLSFNATGGDGYPNIADKPGYVNTGFYRCRSAERVYREELAAGCRRL